ncbi:alcohol dehydrogenase GroES-like domain-containing protein [Apiospora kogelbergensis]|uniref:Alcohol dehydrogenase GroES-like domain-containing protein n=1 Tax=Apiospora kogelbergensis TaxID=1337665 RepID=A0AAW0RBM3_9PEZI
MKALVGGGEAKYRLVKNAEVPSPRGGKMLIHVYAVALNPADAKMADYSTTEGAIGGHDFAGVVVRLGEDVDRDRFKEGDRVLATTIGLSPTDRTTGAFAEYALAFDHLACKIPDSMSFEDACPMGVSIGTAGLALFQTLRLPMPDKDSATPSSASPPIPVLVSGGATSTGTMAIQLLKCAGLTPIATCSPANNALCTSLGAAACFDYRSPTCGADIRAWTNSGLAHVLDCVTDAATMEMCYEAIGTSLADGGPAAYVAIDPLSTRVQYTRRDVRADWVMVYSLLGEPLPLPGVYGRPDSAADRAFGARLFELVEALIAQGRVKGHPVEVRPGGLEAVLGGIGELRMGNVRAKKLVYSLV